MISVIFLFTKNFIIKLTPGLFLRYFYILGDFQPDILIEAILIKKRVRTKFGPIVTRSKISLNNTSKSTL